MKDETLQALHEATLLIAERTDLDDVLQLIVGQARDLLGAEYAALGVPNEKGIFDAFIYSGISIQDAATMGHLPRGFGLLGAIIKEQKAIRVADIASDKRAIGFPENHPYMKSFLGVPVIGEGVSLGNLYLCNKIGADQFSAEDEGIAKMFAAHAAIAIQNARIDEEIQRLVILDERTRIGMDLHDGIIQSIYAVGLTLESTRLVIHENPDEAETLLAKGIEGLNDSIRDIRNFILDLRPHRFDGDLEEGIKRLAREFKANTMIEIDLTLPREGLFGVPPKISRAVFLTTQNGLANVARHSKATACQVNLTRSVNEIELKIVDNGMGFNLVDIQDSVGHGLHNMKTRADQLHGSFELISSPGEGTTIRFNLPL